MQSEEQSLTQRAEEALQEAVNEVIEVARRTHGTLVVWEDGAVRHIPPDQLPPQRKPSPEHTRKQQPSP
jgi:hypothetical protein